MYDAYNQGLMQNFYFNKKIVLPQIYILFKIFFAFLRLISFFHISEQHRDNQYFSEVT